MWLCSFCRYLVPTHHVLLEAMTVHTFYTGQHAVAPLPPHAHADFLVAVTVHVSVLASAGPFAGELRVRGNWSATAAVHVLHVVLAAGQSRALAINFTVNAASIDLWWPNNMGDQPQYDVAAELVPFSTPMQTPDAPPRMHKGRHGLQGHHGQQGGAPPGSKILTATRQVGFRAIAWVTGNDTNQSATEQSEDGDGSASPTFTTFLRVNGARVFARGGSVIPLDELEGRWSALGYRRLVASAAAAGMTMLRIWGGGVYLPEVFYQACDEYGVLIYHDMQYAQEGHSACCSWYGPCWYGRCDVAKNQTQTCSCDTPAGHTQKREIQYQIRRLSSHASIFLWDAVNEAGGFGLFSSFVMTTVAKEDPSRVVWPASPGQGWASGVHTLNGLPNGRALVNQQWCHPLSNSSWPLFRLGCEDTKEMHAPYIGDGGGFNTDLGAYSPSMASHMPGGGSGAGPHPSSKVRAIPLPLPPTFVNPHVIFAPFTTDAWEVGTGEQGVFISEYGVTGMQSFESMAPSFPHAMRGLHADPFHRRNHNSDAMIFSYFGPQGLAQLDETGDAAFKQQLYHSMLAQALHLRGLVEGLRAANIHGMMTWDLNEIWPTGGWGSIEYGAVADGAIEGGRWKPSHYALRGAYADVMAVCGFVGTVRLDQQQPSDTSTRKRLSQQILRCFVRNDSPWTQQVTVSVSVLHLVTGAHAQIQHFTRPVAPAATLGAPNASSAPSTLLNALDWFCASDTDTGDAGSCKPLGVVLTEAGCSVTGSDCVLNVTTSRPARTSKTSSSSSASRSKAEPGAQSKVDLPVVVENIQALVAPHQLVRTEASVEARVNGLGIIVTARGSVALWVVLTTAASGYFTDNVFFVVPGQARSVQFVPFEGESPATAAHQLRTTLRLEHLHQQSHNQTHYE